MITVIALPCHYVILYNNNKKRETMNEISYSSDISRHGTCVFFQLFYYITICCSFVITVNSSSTIPAKRKSGKLSPCIHFKCLSFITYYYLMFLIIIILGSSFCILSWIEIRNTKSEKKEIHIQKCVLRSFLYDTHETHTVGSWQFITVNDYNNG